MTHEILYRPGAAVARVILGPGEAVRAETGAMLAMTGEIDIEARTGGLRRVVGRLLAGESAVQSRFVAARGGGEVVLAPSAPGDVEAIPLRGEGMLVTSGAFLAAEDHLEVDARTRLKNLFVGESLFMLRVSGEGTLFVSAFGAIHARALGPGEILKVETGHLVAWSDGMDVRVGRATRSWVGTALSGEGIVATMTGPGVIYMQTRALSAFGAFVAGFLPSAE